MTPPENATMNTVEFINDNNLTISSSTLTTIEYETVTAKFVTSTLVVGINNTYNDQMVQNSSSVYNNEYDYIYEYNYNDTDFSIPAIEIVPIGIVYGLTFLLGVIGNALVIFSIARFRRMQSVTNVFLLSLSTADLLVVLICVPVKFAKWLSFTWEFGWFMCKFVHYMQNLSLICSVMTLTVISMERYYAIIHPMKAKLVCTKQKAKIVVIAVWIGSAVFSIPILFGQTHQLNVGYYRSGYWCLKQWPTSLIEQLYEIGMLMLVLIIPLCLMSFSYISICKELWVLTYRHKVSNSNGYGEPLTNRNNTSGANSGKNSGNGITRLRSFGNEDTSRKQVIKMLIAIICIFVICWAPYLIDNVLVAFDILHQLHYGYLKPMRQAFVVMSYFNSCVNPMVYAFMSRNFRETFRYALCMCINKEMARKSRYERQLSFTTKSSAYASGNRTVPRELPREQQLDDDIDLGCGITAATFRSYNSEKTSNAEAHSFL